MADLDYYKVLGVSREATDDEIRKAYKKLVRQYHPDARPNDKEAEEKFKQIQEAYAILGDREKRDQYDRYGSAFRSGGARPGGGGWKTYTWSSGSPQGAGPVDLEDIFGGQFDFNELFGGAAAGRRSPFGGARQPRSQPGENIRLDAVIPFQVAAEGGSHELMLRRGGKTERLSVKIPPGVDDGSVIRLASQGHPGYNGGAAGDLLLTVKVAPHPWFRREGANLLVDVPIAPHEAVLGAKVEVPTLSEGQVLLTVPPGTSSGTKLRLRGKGIYNSKTRQRGDQFAVIKIVVPPDLDPESRRLYEQLAERQHRSPREGLWRTY